MACARIFARVRDETPRQDAALSLASLTPGVVCMSLSYDKTISESERIGVSGAAKCKGGCAVRRCSCRKGDSSVLYIICKCADNCSNRLPFEAGAAEEVAIAACSDFSARSCLDFHVLQRSQFSKLSRRLTMTRDDKEFLFCYLVATVRGSWRITSELGKIGLFPLKTMKDAVPIRPSAAARNWQLYYPKPNIYVTTIHLRHRRPSRSSCHPWFAHPSLSDKP